MSSNERVFSAPFFDLHHTTQLCIVLNSSSQLFFSCSDRLSHITTVGLSFSPQKSRSPRPADLKEEAVGKTNVTSFRVVTAKLGAWGRPWTGWICSAPMQISRSLDGALLWWCDDLLLVVVVLCLSVVPRGRAVGLLATKGIPLRITADREMGRASWRKVGLPAQSLPRHHFRHALRAFICTFCMCVCIYVYVCMCADMYIYIHVHVCMYMYMYEFIHMCMRMCMHICA